MMTTPALIRILAVGIGCMSAHKLRHSSGVSRIVLKRGQNRDFGKKEGAKKNKKN